jgi:hypothetical protein
VERDEYSSTAIKQEGILSFAHKILSMLKSYHKQQILSCLLKHISLSSKF